MFLLFLFSFSFGRERGRDTDADVKKQIVLGAPNHYGDGFMLMQHQDSLGHKEIESITVFDNDVGGTLTTLVRIKDVAPVSSKKGSSNGRVKL